MFAEDYCSDLVIDCQTTRDGKSRSKALVESDVLVMAEMRWQKSAAENSWTTKMRYYGY